MKNVLVTGGAGFIGSHFIRYLLRKYPSYKVVNLDALKYSGNLDNLRDVENDPRYAFVRGDICDAEAVERTIREHKIDTIVNFAAESVMPDTFIPVHLGHSIRLETIEELFERYAKVSGVEVNEYGTEIVPVKGKLAALSFRYGMGIWAQVTHITRHHYRGEIITLSQKWGRVTVTPNHSVYNIDAKLVSAATNPELLAIRKINLDRSRFKEHFTLKLRGCYPREEEGKLYYGSPKYPAPKQVWLRRKYEGETLKALVRFLGAYVAEGNATYNKANGCWLVSIGNQDLSFLEEIRRDVRLFSNASGVITKREKPNSHQLVFSSRIIYTLVTQLCGKYSNGKKIPSFIYMLKDEYKQAFLETYLRGDGNVEAYKSVDSWRFTTTSSQLAAGMGLLLSLMGLDYSCYTKEPEGNRSLSFRFRIVSSYDTRADCHIKRAYYEGYVYDLTVEGTNNFAAGIGNIVVHNTHVDRSILTPGSFILTDVYGTYVLLEATRKFELEQMLQVSSDECYGSIEEGSFKETDALDPSSPYSASKAGGDLIARAYYKTFGVPVVITRGSNTFGPFQYPEKIIPLFITNAIDDLPLPLYGDGLNVRDWIYVLDHCEAIDVVLHKGTPGEIYNIGAGNELPNIELTKLILKLLGKPESLIRYVKDRPGHDRRYSLDCTKLRDLGWRPRHRFAEALAETVQWYVENEWWWRKIKSGEYWEYYRRQYEGRELVGD